MKPDVLRFWWQEFSSSDEIEKKCSNSALTVLARVARQLYFLGALSTIRFIKKLKIGVLNCFLRQGHLAATKESVTIKVPRVPDFIRKEKKEVNLKNLGKLHILYSLSGEDAY